MSPLFISKNNKIITVDNKLGIDEACCCSIEYGIMICNANAVRDDNFDVKLNGEKIGVHSANDAVEGTFWVTNQRIDQNALKCGVGPIQEFELCPICAEAPGVGLQLIENNKFVAGNNTLDMVNTGTKGAANYGRVWAFEFLVLANDVLIKQILLSDVYDGPNNASFAYNFNI